MGTSTTFRPSFFAISSSSASKAQPLMVFSANTCRAAARLKPLKPQVTSDTLRSSIECASHLKPVPKARRNGGCL